MKWRLALAFAFLFLLFLACSEEPLPAADCQPQVVRVGLENRKPIFIEDNWLREVRYADSLIIVKQFSLGNSGLCRMSYYHYRNDECYLMIDTVICGPSISHVANYQISRSQDTLWKRGRLFSADGAQNPLDSIQEYFVINSNNQVIASATMAESQSFGLEEYREYRYEKNISDLGFLYAEWKWLGLESPLLPSAVLAGDKEPYGIWYSFQYQENSQGFITERRMYEGFNSDLANLIQCQRFSYF